MTTTTTASINYECPTEGAESLPTAVEADEQTAARRLPLLFWAAALLFAVNAAIVISVWASPTLSVGVYGEKTEPVAAAGKPSPFTERVQVNAARKVKAPEKVRPVLYQAPVYTEAATLNIPRETMSAAEAVDRAADFPRMSAALYQPASVSESATVEVAPLRRTAQP